MGDSEEGEASASESSSPVQDEGADLDFDREPAPPGTGDVDEFPFQKAVEKCTKPLIGLEFVLEQKLDDWKKAIYVCLLCSERKYDIKSIFKHLTRQKHYLTYLEKYFPQFFSIVNALKKNSDNEDGFKMMISHLIGKLEEKYGRLRPTTFKKDIVPVDLLKDLILGYYHFRETSEDEYLKEMLTKEYAENINLLRKNFPIKVRNGSEELTGKDPKTGDSKNENELENNITNTSDISEDSTNMHVVPMDLASSASDRIEAITKPEVTSKSNDEESCCAEIPKNAAMCSTTSKKITLSFVKRKTLIRPMLFKKCSDFDSNSSNSSKALDNVSNTLSASSSSSEEVKSPSRKRSKSRSRKRSRTRSPRRKYSRSRSPVRYHVSFKSRARRNYRRRSPSSSPRYSPEWRRRSRSPSYRRRSSSYSSSSNSPSPRRRKPALSTKSSMCRSAESRHRNDSYKYREAAREVKYGLATRSPSRSREFTKTRSSSRDRRLRRILAHQTVPKSTQCVVRVDAAKSVSSLHNGDNAENGSHKMTRVTSEVTFALKSTINAEKSVHGKEYDESFLYQEKISQIKKRLQEERRTFRKRPEAYPMFEEEWKSFWCRRFKEIQDGGVEDPHNYDYKPDWLRYWLVRVKQIFKDKYKILKAELRENLGLTIKQPAKNNENTENKNVIKHEIVEISDEIESLSPPKEETSDKRQEADVKILTNQTLDEDENNNESKGESSNFAPLPSDAIEQLNLLTQTISACMSSGFSQNATQSIASSTTSKLSQSTGSSTADKMDDGDVDLMKDDLSFVSVLRQLSVLESQLGLSASQVTNLLGKGLAKERVKSGSSADLLTRENRLFLDVVKEKLRGQLILEVVTGNMVKATKTCIKSIDDLMKLIPEPKLADPIVLKIPDQAPAARSISMSAPKSNHEPVHPQTVPLYHHVPHAPPVGQPRYLAGAEGYPSLLTTAYPAHTVASAAVVARAAAGAAPAMIRPEARQPAVSVRQDIVAPAYVPVRQQALAAASSPPRTVVPMPYSSAGRVAAAAAHSSTKRPLATKRPSIYDEIPWSEQMAAPAPLPAPSYHPSSGGFDARSQHTAAAAAARIAPAILPPGRPNVPRPITAGCPPVPHPTSASDPSACGSTATAGGHLRAPCATATAAADAGVASASSGSTSSRGIAVNKPSKDPRLLANNVSSALSSTISSNPPQMPRVSPATSFPSTSLAPHVTSATSKQAAALTSSSHCRDASATVNCAAAAAAAAAAMSSVGGSTSASSQQQQQQQQVNSSWSTVSPTVIDLTDDGTDIPEERMPVNQLSEPQLIQMVSNFKNLSKPRQKELIEFMRKLEAVNPEAVENVKKQIKLSPR